MPTPRRAEAAPSAPAPSDSTPAKSAGRRRPYKTRKRTATSPLQDKGSWAILTLTAYAATLAAFLVIDLLWLGVVAKRFYAAQLGPLLREQFNLAAVGGFYLAYVAGIVYFAVLPALTEGALATAALNGALLGLLAYGTYDMTNLATLKGWPLTMSLVDMAWGTLLTGAAASLGVLAMRALGS